MTARSPSVALGVVATAAAMAMLYVLQNVLIPLVLAFVLAVLLGALVRFIRRRAPRLAHWAVLSLAAAAVLICAVVTAAILSQGIARIVEDVPELVERIDLALAQIGRSIGLGSPLRLVTLTGDIDPPAIISGLAGGVGGFLSGFLLMITYFGFILAGRRAAARKLRGLSEEIGAPGKLEAVVKHISKDIEAYIWVQTVTGLMIAGASATVMAAVGLDNVAFWATLLFLLSYIPMVGVTVGSIFPSLFALLQFPTWWQAQLVFIGIQAISFVVGNFIYPKMQAQTQNIDPVATLLSLAFWGSLWGIAGAFLAVPLTLMIMMACAHFPQTHWIAVLLSNDGRPASPADLPAAATGAFGSDP